MLNSQIKLDTGYLLGIVMKQMKPVYLHILCEIIKYKMVKGFFELMKRNLYVNLAPKLQITIFLCFLFYIYIFSKDWNMVSCLLFVIFTIRNSYIFSQSNQCYSQPSNKFTYVQCKLTFQNCQQNENM